MKNVWLVILKNEENYSEMVSNVCISEEMANEVSEFNMSLIEEELKSTFSFFIQKWTVIEDLQTLKDLYVKN